MYGISIPTIFDLKSNGSIQLPVQSVPITTAVVSSNLAQARCTLYNIMWWSLSMTCDRSVVFSTNKIDHQDITEILLKVALNTPPSNGSVISKKEDWS